MNHANKKVLLAGNPNAGKTTLFNALTGSSARTGNYPGITVERRSGTMSLPGGESIEVIDLPGTYSLTARSREEQVAVDSILPIGARPAELAVVVCDATALERHLYLALAIRETGLPIVIALNMMDEARALGIEIDVPRISQRLDCEVIDVVARSGAGLDRLGAAIERTLAGDHRPPEPLSLSHETENDVREIELAIEPVWPPPVDAHDPVAARRARAIWALLSLGDDELEDVPPRIREAVVQVEARAAIEGRAIDREIIGARYAKIDALTGDAVRMLDGAPRVRIAERLDSVLTHPLAGFVVFAVVMAFLFQALFAWSEPMISAIESVVSTLQSLTRGALPPGPLRELLIDGVIAGVGNVIVFVPQIAMLSAFIAVLEDSGYLARVAFVIDRVMHGVGLHGRAFVPLLSGFACAIPAVLATRTIENRRDRLVTMLALPLMSCSARLPVYTLVIAVAFPATATAFAGLSVGAVALFGMYALSVTATLGAAAVLRRTVLRGPRPALVLELPPYRWPLLRNVLRATWTRTKAFVRDAGTIILAITVVLWALLSYPRDPAIEARYDSMRAAAHQELGGDDLARRMVAIDAANAGERMEHSAAGSVGHAIEPVITPLGFDWRIGIGLIGSFAAREVLVSTLGIVYGVGEDANEENDTLRSELRAARRSDGTRIFTPLVGISLMVFFVLAAQCMSTLAIVRRESGSWKWPLLMVVYMNALAYLASLAIYQVGRLLGFS